VRTLGVPARTRLGADDGGYTTRAVADRASQPCPVGSICL